MKPDSSLKRWNALLLWALRIMLVFFVLAILAGMKFPLVSGDRSAFVALIHLGVAAGIVSNWRFIVGLKWTEPINIIGTILGMASVLVIIIALKDIEMPVISGYAAAFQALGAFLMVKIGLKIIQDRKDKRPAP